MNILRDYILFNMSNIELSLEKNSRYIQYY